jgi:hypothetical protein
VAFTKSDARMVFLSLFASEERCLGIGLTQILNRSSRWKSGPLKTN